MRLGLIARVAEALQKSVGRRVGLSLVAGPFSPVAFLLSSVCRGVIYDQHIYLQSRYHC